MDIIVQDLKKYIMNKFLGEFDEVWVDDIDYVWINKPNTNIIIGDMVKCINDYGSDIIYRRFGFLLTINKEYKVLDVSFDNFYLIRDNDNNKNMSFGNWRFEK